MMDFTDLRRKLLNDLDNLIARTWVIDAETRRILRGARRTAEENDAWLDVLLETVNKTYEPVPEIEETESLPEGKPTLVALAQQVGGNLKEIGYGFSITVIIAIIGVLIQLFQACKQSHMQAKKRAANPRLLDRIALRRAIWQHDYDGDDAEALEAALLDAGATLTTAAMKALYKETEEVTS